MNKSTSYAAANEYATANEYAIAYTQWLAQQGVIVESRHFETACTHWEAERKSALRRAGIRIPGDRGRMTHGRYL
jgi:hypothetical protein